jgi:tight adherence protein C
MEAAHPELSSELWVVNRKMNAGMVRDEAVSGLWRRTGVEEMRGLCSSIIQSERLGTSIARVLRTYAETLRRKRKQAAEKRAAEAALKMIFPLAVFLLPALFAVILGPAAIKAGEVMRNINAP